MSVNGSERGAFFRYNFRETEKEFQSLIRRYAALPSYVSRQQLRQAVARAITPFKAAVRAVAPVKTGGLRRSVASKVKFYSRTYPSVVGVVGFVRKKDKRKMGYHAAIIEGGTKDRVRKSGGRTGRVTATPMVRPVLQAYRSAILANVMREMATGLERSAAKLGMGKN